MKNKLIIGMLMLGITAFSQTNKPTFIKGDLNIKYNTRTSAPGTKGVFDVYNINVNVCDSAVFRGTVKHTPLIVGGLMNSIQQPGSLNYEMECDVVNPNNPAQTKNVGRIYGLVPIDENGVYRFSNGNLKVGVLQIGQARGFESKFSGLALGKPPVKSESLISKLKKETLNIKKQINGKTVTVAVKKYDKMTFQNHVFASGPVQIYGEATVNGDMVFDYDRYCWYFQGVTIAYVVDGKQLVDKLGGNIRWIEPPNRKSTGEGYYEFDIRLNEPPPSENSVFSGPSDEASFFQTDNTIPSLTGMMKYKDALNGDKVLSSVVQIDLHGNNLNRQQVMNLCKLIMISSIVPINAE